MKLIALLLLFTVSLHAEDWIILGKTYENVTVVQIEADCVHITYSDGIGRIMIADMPPDLQKRFAFDPIAAKAASDAKAKALSDAEAYLASQPKPVVTTAPNVASAPSKPTVDTSAIQTQIASLQTDIDQENRIRHKEGEDVNGHAVNHSGNGYADEIASQQAQIDALKAQLH